MERVDGEEYEEYRNAWYDFLRKEIDNLQDISSEAMEAYERLPKEVQERTPLIVPSDDGAAGFQKALDYATHNEFWIVYASLVPIDRVGHAFFSLIEMFVSCSTIPKAPMIANMGIQRTSNYMGRKRRKHGRLSMVLHSFIAKVMLQRYGPKNKLYMITVPVGNMARMLKGDRRISSHVYVGDNRMGLRTQNEEKLRKAIGEPYDILKRSIQFFRWKAQRLVSRETVQMQRIILDSFESVFHPELPIPEFDEDGKVTAIFMKARMSIQQGLDDISRKKDQELSMLINSYMDAITYSEPEPGQSPIVWSGNTFTLYNQARNAQIFSYDTFTGHALYILDPEEERVDLSVSKRSYGWFFGNEDMKPSGEFDYVTVDLVPLATYDRPECVDENMRGT